ncbi:MAG: serpin family protein, partial [Candidatus Kapaibacteriota bacterium]
VALSMTMNGALGETFEAMRNTLVFDKFSFEQINSAFKEMLPLLSDIDKNVILKIANSVWAREGIDFNEKFLSDLEDYYNAYCKVLNFSHPEAKNVINNWVEQKTNGKIKEIVKEIPYYAVMYIINAIYFKGIWKYSFDKSKTKDNFFVIDYENESIFLKTKFMTQVRDFYCYTNSEFSAIRLPYGKGSFAMVLILPNAITMVNDFINSFDRNKWERCLNNLKETEQVTLHMPKFKCEFEVGLKEILSAMGMSIAFTENADLSGICKTLRCTITDVKHKSCIEVDEEGTEASAATSVEISNTSLKPTFLFNRPFVYVIYEQNTGAILFMGKLFNPALN